MRSNSGSYPTRLLRQTELFTENVGKLHRRLDIHGYSGARSQITREKIRIPSLRVLTLLTH